MKYLLAFIKNTVYPAPTDILPEYDLKDPLVIENFTELFINNEVKKKLKNVRTLYGGIIIDFTIKINEEEEPIMFSITWDKKILLVDIIQDGYYKRLFDIDKDDSHFEVLNNKAYEVISNLW